MIRIVCGVIGLTFLCWNGFGQSAGGFKSYKTQEDYCRENPKMPTCIDGRPFKNVDLGSVGIYKPPASAPASSGGARSTARPPQRQQAPEASPDVALQDWRFSHSSPALLININIKSLLQSPIWKTLLSVWAAGGVDLKAEDVDKVRSALGDIGQLLISVSANRTSTPSVLILAKGNVDSALGLLLRSDPSMQSKRLDAFTMLIGDPDSMRFATLQMQGHFPRKTWNPLQQTATLESQKYDVWVGVDPRHLASMGSLLGGGSNQATAMLANLRGFSVGIYLRDQIRIEAGLEAPSPDIAQRMLAAYQQMQARQKSGQEQVWTTVEGAKLQFIAIVDPAQFKGGPGFDSAAAQMMAPQIGPLLHALAGLGSTPRPASAEPPNPSQGKIVIQGLENGPK
jgi:hypothetical protein